jgi:O-antigen ligase
MLGRLSFWATLVRQGADSPVVGKGMASFDIGTAADISYSISSAHNTLVSAFYTSGVPGLVIVLLLWRAAFRGIYRLDMNTPEERWRARFLTVSIMVLLLVSITNDMTAGRGNLLMFLLALLNYRTAKSKGDNVRQLAK